MNTECKEFLAAMVPTLPEDQRMIVCGFEGDPTAAPPYAWKPKPWQPGGKLGLARDWNAYITVSSFFISADHTWRRRKSLFAGGYALMVDDVGTGGTAKVNPEKINVYPSAKIETSPGNFQYWYFLDSPEPNAPHFDAVIRAFIAGKLLGLDPGMAGVTRVGRLPGFTNGKKKYRGFTTRLVELNDRSFSIQDLIDRFYLELRGQQRDLPFVATQEHIRRNRAFLPVYKFLRMRGMLKRDEPDPSGWTEMTCPWVEAHTDGIDNGAAICEPAQENAYWGAFRCHHGHCLDKTWRHLTEWIHDIAADELSEANRRAQ